MAPFTIVEGVTEEALRAASAALQEEFLERQDDFVRPELVRGGDGGWADLV